MKYFGTDGIRGVVDKTIDKKLIKKICNAILMFYKKHKLNNVLLVGNDSRISSDYILSNIESSLLNHGIQVDNIGICSSPCLAYLCKKYKYPLAMMISASHNSWEYNGIKFFNSKGEKLSEKYEQEFESFMDLPARRHKVKYALRKNVENFKYDYISMLKRLKRFDFPCIIDSACGGASEIVKSVFKRQFVINSNFNGYNINENSGCTNIDLLKFMCVKNHLCGFAIDGDGDRLNIVDEKGNIISGDKILFILSKFFQKSNDILVGTKYTNLGLENALNKRNIKLLRADVGDKKVYHMMKEYSSTLGGENSGHIIIKHHTSTGDGILTAIIICNIIEITNLTFDELLTGYHEYHQEFLNLKLDTTFSLNEDMKCLINKYETDGARIVVRPSGTEPVLRIMVEHKDEKSAKNIINHIKNLIKT